MEGVGGLHVAVYIKRLTERKERPCGFFGEERSREMHLRMALHGISGTLAIRDGEEHRGQETRRNRERDPSNKWQIPRSPPTSHLSLHFAHIRHRYMLASRSHRLDESCRSHFHLPLLFSHSENGAKRSNGSLSIFRRPFPRGTQSMQRICYEGPAGPRPQTIQHVFEDRINKKATQCFRFSLAMGCFPGLCINSHFHDNCNFKRRENTSPNFGLFPKFSSSD